MWPPAAPHPHPALITGPLSAPTPATTTNPLQILYHGPREGVLPFFRAHLGFDCPPRKGVADFLQEIALPSDQQVRVYGSFSRHVMRGWGERSRQAPFERVPGAFLRSPLSPPSRRPRSFPASVPQKYWADNTRPYSYVTAQTIRQAFWQSEASEPQRLMLAAPAEQQPVCGDDNSAALTTSK